MNAKARRIRVIQDFQIFEKTAALFTSKYRNFTLYVYIS
jgi:hypothetical protein